MISHAADVAVTIGELSFYGFFILGSIKFIVDIADTILWWFIPKE